MPKKVTERCHQDVSRGSIFADSRVGLLSVIFVALSKQGKARVRDVGRVKEWAVLANTPLF